MRVPAGRSETSGGHSATSPARTIVARVGAIGTSKRRRSAVPGGSRPLSVDRSSGSSEQAVSRSGDPIGGCDVEHIGDDVLHLKPAVWLHWSSALNQRGEQ